MRIIADLHVHSKYARATSPEFDIDGIAEGAKYKGITVVATGDFTHPQYFTEIKAKLMEWKDGLAEYKGVKFILSTEVSVIYELNGRTKKMHHVLLAPSLETAAQVNERIRKYGDIGVDGRPMLSISSAGLVEELLAISRDIVIIPAHAWTPWFSIFGSNSGVNSVEEAFEDKADKIFALETGLSCYDDKTEILTENGWKLVSKVVPKDKICTLNPKTDEIEYQKPIKTYKYSYTGQMYRLRTKRIDLLVTPNHNLYYSTCDFRNRKPYRLGQAKFLFGKSRIFKKDGVWKGKKTAWFTLPAVRIKHGSRYYSGYRKKPEKRIPIEPWLKFFGFWVAEGWTSRGKEGDYNILVSNTDQKLLDEMEVLLKGFGYAVYRDEKIVRVRDFQLFHYLERFGKAGDKYVAPEVKCLPPNLLKLFFDYYILGDGHRYGRTGKGLSATTISERLRDDLQEIALKLGMAAYYKLHHKKGRPFSSPSQGKTYLQSKDSWNIYFTRRNRPIVLPSTIKKWGYTEAWEDYSGLVYCVEVPNHVVYIRRNGIPIWCGNSDPAMNWMISALDRFSLVSNSDAHSKPKLGREANVFELEKVGFAEIMDSIRTRKGFVKTYEFYPEEGKYHYDGHRDCKVNLTPWEAKKYNNICPVCRKKLTIGVLHRVADLADRKYGFKPEKAVPFQHIVPLQTVIAKALGKTEFAKAVFEEQDKLVRYFGNEFAVYEATDAQLRLATTPAIADAIIRVNTGRVKWVPGHDGVFGELVLGDEKAGTSETVSDRKQKNLTDF